MKWRVVSQQLHVYHNVQFYIMEAYGDWVAFNEVRDAYSGYAGSCGDMAEYRRRLAAPTPSGNECAAHVAQTRRASAETSLCRHLCHWGCISFRPMVGDSAIQRRGGQCLGREAA